MDDKDKKISDAVVTKDTTTATPQTATNATEASTTDAAPATPSLIASNDSAAKTTTQQPDTPKNTESEKKTAPEATDTPAKDTSEEKKEADTSSKEEVKIEAAPAEETPAKEEAITPAVVPAETTEGTGGHWPWLSFIAGVLTSLIAWQIYTVVTSMPVEPDLSFPDPVALIDGEPVSQQIFEQNATQMLAAAASQGMNVTDAETRREIALEALEIVVNTRLLVAAARAEELTVSDEEIDTRITELEFQFGGPEVLAAEMTRLGLDDEALRADIEEQLIVDRLLTEVVVPENIEVSQEEITEVYDSLVESGQEIPPLAEIEEGITAQLQQQRQQELIQTYIDDLREAADIEIRL